MTKPIDPAAWPAAKVRMKPIAKLVPNARNSRQHPPAQVEQIAASMLEFGWTMPVLEDEAGVLIAGHGRLLAAEALVSRGHAVFAKAPVMTATGWSEAQKRAYLIADNRLTETSIWDKALLRVELTDLQGIGVDPALLGFSADDLAAMFAPADAGKAKAAGSLAEKFGIPPFTVLDARQGWWQRRKAAWLALGIKSEIGRGENLLRMSETILEPDKSKRQQKTEAIKTREWAKGKQASGEIEASHPAGGTGTSIFDPVLCELAYRWFSPPGGAILDPFAGGSVRGIVASRLGRDYFGVDLRMEQIAANREQAEAILTSAGDRQPRWVCGDSAVEGSWGGSPEADMIFSCPPYGDLEVYSDDPRDLSKMEWPKFAQTYRRIVHLAAERLKANSFACFVVGDIRDGKGFYRGLPGETIRAFEAAGCKLYNEAVLVTAVGSLAMRASRQFEAARKLGKAHQNVLVFCKGDPKKATKRLGDVEFGTGGLDGVEEL